MPWRNKGVNPFAFTLQIGLDSGVLSASTLLISPQGSNLISFGHGWHPELEGDSQSPHRWSTGLDASIIVPKLSPSPLHKGLVTVELEAIPYIPTRGPGSQDVIIFLDGSLICGFRMYDAEVKTFSGYFSNPTNNNAFSQVRIFLPHSVKPSLVGEGADERQLGIAIKKLKIELA